MKSNTETTTAAALNVKSIMQDSGCKEWYSPDEIMEIVHRALGHIELDPASCEAANVRVKAARFFTEADDGLSQEWKAETLWLNHPFSKGEKPCKKSKKTGEYLCKKKACQDRGYHVDEEAPSNAAWINKLVDEFQKGSFKRGINITFASTSEGWFKPLLEFPQGFLYGRVNFVNEQGEQMKGVTKGAVLTFFGMTKEEAQAALGDKGKVKL